MRGIAFFGAGGLRYNSAIGVTCRRDFSCFKVSAVFANALFFAFGGARGSFCLFPFAHGVTLGIDMVIDIRISARAFVCGVTLIRAGRSGYGHGIFMCVVKNGNGFGFGFVAVFAGVGTDTRFGFGWLFCGDAFSPAGSCRGDSLLFKKCFSANGAFFTVGQTAFRAGCGSSLDGRFRMTFGIHIVVGIRIAARTIISGETLFRTGGSGYGRGIFMRVSENGNGFRFCFGTISASEGFDARFSFGRFFGNDTVVPCVSFFCRVIVDIGITARTIISGETLSRAGGSSYGRGIFMRVSENGN